jgi:microcystin-dependent protein
VSSPYLSEVRIVAFNFPPKGWAFCNGQLLAINQNQALFALLGTTYGGNGTTTFALPDLRSRGPMHFGQGPGLASRSLGERSGEENHTLIASEMPAHTHLVNVVNTPGTQTTPAGNFFASNRGGYAESGNVPMHSGAVANAGGSQPHANLPPYLTLNFCIALVGIFPSQN